MEKLQCSLTNWFAGTIDNAKDSSVKNVEVITFPVVSDKQDATDSAGGAGASFFVNKNTDTPKNLLILQCISLKKWVNRLWNLVQDSMLEYRNRHR